MRPEALDRPLLWDDEYAFVDPAEVVDELVARATAGPLYVDRVSHDDPRTGPPPPSFRHSYKRRPAPAWSLDDPPPPRTPADPTPVYLDPAGTVWQPTRDGLDEVTSLPAGTLPAAGWYDVWKLTSGEYVILPAGSPAPIDPATGDPATWP